MNIEREASLELLNLLADSLDQLERVAPIPEDIYNLTAMAVVALREYLNQ